VRAVWVIADSGQEDRDMVGRDDSDARVRQPRTEFLNVDVDLIGASEVDYIARTLSPALIVAHREPGRISLELSQQPKSADDAVAELARVLTHLPTEAKAMWDNCQSREVNIGIQAGREPHEARFTISQKSLSLVAALRADIVVTVYANDDS
jgi:hypothetical protein